MEIDYAEVISTENELNLAVGVHFEDEPDSYYVVDILASPEGRIRSLELLFNGFSCKYTFKPDEKEQLVRYLNAHNPLALPWVIPDEEAGVK
ncbi:hypothetical protein [Paenibacillus chitinolyticus]|uniref:hypothetical protein n=1 Tax=Paenibacillus chitinolyticus TaxID=79263 RepID=UPI00366BC842